MPTWPMVHIVLLSTDESKPTAEHALCARPDKAGGLFNALTFGDIMLRNQLKNEKK